MSVKCLTRGLLLELSPGKGAGIVGMSFLESPPPNATILSILMHVLPGRALATLLNSLNAMV